MEKNISANLNFADSLSDFQEDVTKLLDFKNIEEWSGRIVKERFEIRIDRGLNITPLPLS